MPTLFQINYNHSHKINVVEAYSYLRMSPETQEIFLKYFDDGMTPSAAREYHEIKLANENDENGISVVLANAQINPTERQVKHLYCKWRKEHFGSREDLDVIAALKKKQTLFAELGATVAIHENPLIIIVLTPIMMRAHTHLFSHEIVFVDSSGSCDQTNSCISFFFGATKVGAVPLACVLHTEQSEENCTAAFQLLRDTLPKDSFGGFGFPNIFMTDDSSAERNALKNVFPESRRLLCIFHVCQAMWRWLWDSRHGILKNDRRHIMLLFRRVMYSNTIEEIRENYDYILNDAIFKKYDNIQAHFAIYWDRREEWSLAYRTTLLTRGNNTNNYVEASIRIFKDIVLQRCKAFNACALVDFVVNVFESYQKRHLLSFVNFRNTKNEILFRKMSHSANISVKRIDENTFLVSSETDDHMFYTAYVDISFCDCIFGQGGRFCKHLCAIQNKFGITFRNCMQINSDDRKELARLALGENISPEFYNDMSTDVSIISNDLPTSTEHQSNVVGQQDNLSNEIMNTVEDANETNLDDEHSAALTELSEHFERISKITSKNKTVDMINAMRKFNKTLNKITTPSDLFNFIHVSKNISLKRNISVQPTSMSRRKIRCGLTSGAKRIQAGRPSKKEIQKNPKRQRSLKKNIDLNKPNAKSHGNAH